MSERKPDRLRILHLTAPAPFGGLERVVTALALGHQAAGHEVHVAAIVSPDEQDHPFLSALHGSGAKMHPVFLRDRAYWGDWLEAARLCREIDPHVVHSHSVRTDVIAARAAARQGRATITTVHGASLQGGKSSLYEWLQLRSYRRFDAVVSVSADLHRRLAGEGPAGRRARLIPNAWPDWGRALPRTEARQALGLPVEGFVVGWAARMIPVKGGDVFLEAIDRLEKFDGQIAIVGDGPSREALEQQASTLRRRDQIHFLGGREGAGRLFSAFDLFVMSSRSEGMPIAIFEAASSGVPIVSTDVGGIPEMLLDGEALLVASEDAGALARAIEASWSDPEHSKERARRASEGVRERFSRERWLDLYEATYRQIVEARQG
jgi:glycosyltransferase involved in cell wall biosynthesis